MLQDSISLQHSRLQARAFQDAEEEGDTSSKAEGLPSALASLEHPALATVFTQEAAKHMPKLKLAEDYYPELNRERVNILGRLV